MTALALASFAIVFGIACASPGPSISALIARVIGKGAAGAEFFCAGLLLGDLVWLACAVFGLATLAAQFQPRMRRLVRNTCAVRLVNRVTGTVMGGAAVAVAIRS